MSLNEINPPTEGASAPDRTTPEPSTKPRRPPRDSLYFAVITLLLADIVLGLGIAVFAIKIMDFQPMAVGGLGLAGLGLGILAYFVLFGSGRPKS